MLIRILNARSFSPTIAKRLQSCAKADMYLDAQGNVIEDASGSDTRQSECRIGCGHGSRGEKIRQAFTQQVIAPAIRWPATAMALT